MNDLDEVFQRLETVEEKLVDALAATMANKEVIDFHEGCIRGMLHNLKDLLTWKNQSDNS